MSSEISSKASHTYVNVHIEIYIEGETKEDPLEKTLFIKTLEIFATLPQKLL